MNASMNPRTQSAADAGVQVSLSVPPMLAADTPAPLVYRLSDARGGAPLTDVVLSHERPLHLIVVSRDLDRFQHVHPQPTGAPGEYALDVTFPAAGSYLLYAEFARANGQDIVQRDEVTVGGVGGSGASLAEDRAPKTVGAARVALRGPDAVAAGQEATLTFWLEDTETGAPLRDLQPYLGAPAHVVILSEDAGRFAHTHGEAVGGALPPGHGAHAIGAPSTATHASHTASTYGPAILFRHTFPAPGLYKLWGQFQTGDGQVVTADFVVRAQ